MWNEEAETREEQDMVALVIKALACDLDLSFNFWFLHRLLGKQ